jgi:redox-sensitive bicupin YhaK (pirin superfamily)
MSSKKIQKIQEIKFQWEMESPFIACMHHNDAFPKGNENQGPDVSLSGRNLGSDFSGKDGFSMYHGESVPGFPVHPHRGFETVTVVLKGLVDHFDSVGSEGRYGNGDVQWLTTGKGCQHVEMFPLVNQDKGNPLELFQIWLNMCSKDKFVEPDYKMFWSEDIPIVENNDANGNKVAVKIITGSFKQKDGLKPCPSSWANDRTNNVGIYLIQMNPGASLTVPAVSKTLLRNLYFYQGSGVINIEDEVISSSNRVKLSGNDEIIISNGDKESYMILLEGEPIQEAVVQYGPFVMNTEKEIREAFSDYQKTQFGGWPWDRPDPIHERSTGRFARYADGTIETR